MSDPCGVVPALGRRGAGSAARCSPRRGSDRAAEHPHLAEGGVLELELRDAPSVGEHSEQANEHEVGEGSQGARMLPATPDESGTEYWSHPRVADTSKTEAGPSRH